MQHWNTLLFLAVLWQQATWKFVHCYVQQYLSNLEERWEKYSKLLLIWINEAEDSTKKKKKT
jgi:hypothetical protein